MSGRPEFSKGYLGAQPKFAEFGLSTVSHDSPEINLEGNEVRKVYSDKNDTYNIRSRNNNNSANSSNNNNNNSNKIVIAEIIKIISTIL